MSNIIEFQQPVAENEVELVEYVFTNDHANPYPQQILHLIYDYVFKNLVGIMQAKHKTSGAVHTLLVGLEKAEEGVNTYPLARILSLEEQNEYLGPGGKGGFSNDNGD